MRYKIVVTCPEKETAIKVRTLLLESKIYKSKEIMYVSLIKEVCDECADKYN